jgi:hypothetical protein
MVIVGIALEREQHEVMPTGVLGGRDVEDNGHQGLDVLDANGRSMEATDGGSLECVD